MDSPSFGATHQYGQAPGGCADPQPAEEAWAGAGYSQPASAETLGPDD